VAAVLLSAAPAYAHYNTITVTVSGASGSAFGSINSGHTTMSVCLRSNDADTAKLTITSGSRNYSVYDYSNNNSCVTRQIPDVDYDQWRICMTRLGAGRCVTESTV
jgi:hypothetical protein